MSLSHKKHDIAKAILEGLTYELRVNLDLMKAGGVRIDTLRAIGGGAKSDLWLQLKADITGITVLRPRITEAAAWGAAILAGAGAGVFAGVAQAADAGLQIERTFEPDPNRSRAYGERYELYTQIYPLLAPFLHKI